MQEIPVGSVTPRHSPVTSLVLPGNQISEPALERVPLTRGRVLVAALRLVDAEGLEALTRRRLGRELGCEAMALYRYVPDQAALLDGIVELVLDELVIPDDRGSGKPNCGTAPTTFAS